jgi:hypothetical protein
MKKHNLFFKRIVNKFIFKIPSSRDKQKIVKQYAKDFNLKILLETGTYLGSMVDASKDDFEKIFSIELDKNLFIKAKKKFRQHKNIQILNGDSSKVLKKILINVNKPCLFWLDAHYSKGITARGKKETPVLEELNYIFKHPVGNHVILIDDARLFKGKNDYPSLGKIRQLVADNLPHYKMEVKRDIIRIFKEL